MNSLLVILSVVAVASAIPMKLIPIQVLESHTQSSEYNLKTDHPVHEPPTIIKGIPKPYAVPVPQPYAVPRAIPVEVPRPYPVTVTRTIPVPIVQQGEPIVRTRVIRTNDDDNDGGYGGEGLSLGGYGGEGLSLGGYGGESLSLGGHGNDGGYGNDRGYGKQILVLRSSKY